MAIGEGRAVTQATLSTWEDAQREAKDFFFFGRVDARYGWTLKDAQSSYGSLQVGGDTAKRSRASGLRTWSLIFDLWRPGVIVVDHATKPFSVADQHH